ncbi:GntR family transcriptional regulator [Halobacillus sp. HZG1]|uniref:GntR family transcriptional regulator n=1 Tax=Halobacillus sp. HZG1 TaxID=3111769 RepID=UPI002DB7503C|nr:GntR family transcriptional regulator [Halobacillus sp. HZG1]MEC3883381.1 GntR family transcriptional regulator [Halobacillus sp. HZG1]
MKDSNEFLYPSQWLSKASAGERVACELRMRIISGTVESGSILSENQLASEFSVSRSPVRDALKALASENLIRLERMGARVLDITEKEIQEMYDVRLLIESFVFERLVHMETEELVKDLSKIFEMMKIAIQYKDADEFSKQDLEFHDTIIRSIGHSHIQMIWNNLKPTLESLVLLSMRYRFEEMYEDFERIIENHELYIEAIHKKDRELMVQSLHKNFDDVAKGRVEELWMAQETFTKGVEKEDD